MLNNINITFNGITKLLNGLKPNKSPESYNLGPRLLKELAEDIAPLLLMILHKSLATGEVPDDWHTANDTTAFKKRKKYQAENYRPISLTSICCKIMEHVIASQIMNNGQKEDILYPLQHGFRRGRSCGTQLIEFVDDLSNNLHTNQQTDVFVMDFAKAFDKVCHSLLTHKLHYYGIQGNVNRWFKNWLASRKQSVVVKGEQSQFVSVASGVPQGSVLGPRLFLTSIICQRNSIHLYDIAYLLIRSHEDADLLQEDLVTLAEWEEQWRMKCYSSKGTKMAVTSKRKPILSDYYLDSHILANVPTAKYLGFTLTQDLKWNTIIKIFA